MKPLDPNDAGTEGVRLLLKELKPDRATAAARVFGTPGVKYPEAPNYPVEGTIEQLIANQNELIGKVAALEARPSAPFPVAS
jgi:hypothetical protein